MTNQFEKLVGNLYVEGKYNKENGAPGVAPCASTNDNFEIVIYSIETNLAYKCVFVSANITIPNTTLQGIFTMITNALDSKPNYSIKWELKDLHFVITYQNDIFTFTQMINLLSTDFSIPQVKYQLFCSNQEITKLKQNTAPLDKFIQLEKQVQQMSLSLNELKSQIENLKSELEKNKQTSTNTVIPITGSSEKS
jgi:hypothetical protein